LQFDDLNGYEKWDEGAILYSTSRGMQHDQAHTQLAIEKYLTNFEYFAWKDAVYAQLLFVEVAGE
jgi:hypothetical protein